MSSAPTDHEFVRYIVPMSLCRGGGSERLQPFLEDLIGYYIYIVLRYIHQHFSGQILPLACVAFSFLVYAFARARRRILSPFQANASPHPAVRPDLLSAAMVFRRILLRHHPRLPTFFAAAGA
jgi:hypothetical protein